jgi:hypothetical protein
VGLAAGLLLMLVERSMLGLLAKRDGGRPAMAIPLYPQ